MAAPLVDAGIEKISLAAPVSDDEREYDRHRLGPTQSALLVG
jgi:hypothetical protein